MSYKVKVAWSFDDLGEIFLIERISSFSQKSSENYNKLNQNHMQIITSARIFAIIFTRLKVI